MARATMQEIANQLGISKFAVSRALSSKPGVSEATRQRIVEAAKTLGYVTKPKSAKRSKSIEIIYHDPDVAHRELWVAVQAGAQEEGARLGFETAVRWTADTSLIARLKSNAVGFVVIGPHDRDMIEAVRATGLPCVRIGALPLLDSMDQVNSTDREGARAVAELLLELGHRRFVYAQGKPGYQGRIDRGQTFAEVIAARKGTGLREMTFREDDSPGDFRRSLMRMVSRGFEPTGFFCGNDGVAVTVISELMRMGLRVPEDVSVVGHADYAIATQVAPQLTTVRVPHRAMGLAAARLLLSRAGAYGPRNDLPPYRITLVDELVIRESTAAPPETSWARRVREAQVTA